MTTHNYPSRLIPRGRDLDPGLALVGAMRVRYFDAGGKLKPSILAAPSTCRSEHPMRGIPVMDSVHDEGIGSRLEVSPSRIDVELMFDAELGE